MADLTPDRVRERLAHLDRFLKEASNLGTWDMIVPFMDPTKNRPVGLHGEFKDWPPYVQDVIWKSAALQIEPRKGYGIRVVASGCYQDVPTEPCYLRVVMQEYIERPN